MTGETPMFEIAAEGELFDTRALTVATATPRASDPDGACPACGRPTRGRQGLECERCETAGHQARRLAHDLGTDPVPTDRKG
jgi:hypothetical protein